jgi:hypothetical protein
VGDDGGQLTRPAGGGDLDQPLLDGEQAGMDQRCSSRVRSATTLTARSARTVGQLLQLGPSGAGQSSAEADQDVEAAEGGRGRGQPIRASRSSSRLTTSADTVRSWLWGGVRPVTSRD